MSEKKMTFSGRLPGEDGNGLESFADELASRGGPARPLVVVGLVDQDKWSVKKSSGEEQAIVRLTRVEVLEGADASAAVRSMGRAYAHRTGNEPLFEDVTDAGDVVVAEVLEIESGDDA